MKLALYGYGGHAREVAAQMGKKVEFYVDDEFKSRSLDEAEVKLWEKINK